MIRLLPRHVILIVTTMAGCASNAPKPDPTRATVTITVKAEPKSGWRDTGGQTSAYEPAQPGMSPAYRTIDYAGLDEIVVWIEPSQPVDADASPLQIDIAAPPIGTQAAGRTSAWRISNTGSESQVVFLRSDDGQLQNVGAIKPGAAVDVTPTLSGPAELMLESREEPIARVFVAPSPFVRVAEARKQTTFVSVPPGRATVACWHPRLPGSSQETELFAGKHSRIDLRVTVNELPKVP